MEAHNMFADPYPAHDDIAGGTETTHDYTLLSLESNASNRVNFDAADGEPKVLRISHTPIGKGTTARVRHLAKFTSFVVEDGLENTGKPIALYAVADIPVSGVTAGQKADLFTQFVGAIRGASGDAANEGDSTEFFDRWVNGES